MAGRYQATLKTKKLKKPLDRQFNTAVYFLRCKQLGFTFRELFDIEYGEVNDLLVEQANDHEEYNYKATQADFDHAFPL